MKDEILLTSVSLFDILSQIPELSGCEINVTDDGRDITMQIDDVSYIIHSRSSDVVKVPQSVVDDVTDIIDDRSSSTDVSTSSVSSVESGIIKELAKTLAVGGLVRLSAKLLSK